MCGETINYDEGAVTARCPHCGTVQAVAKNRAETPEAPAPSASAARSGVNNMKLILCAAAVFAALLLVWYITRMTPGQSGGTPTVAEPAQGGTVGPEKYEEMANAGDAEAQFILGEMYFKGEGVKRDTHLAARWYRKAAEQGHVGAQVRLGEAHYNGWGVEKNYKEALMWYRKAARRNNPDAQVAVGNMYYNGMGVTKSDKDAVWWYAQAARQSHPWAQYYLGNMYRNGLGVQKDIERARDLYLLAAQQGHLAAWTALESLKGK